MTVGLGESSQQQKRFQKASESSHWSDSKGTLQAGVSFYKETKGIDAKVDKGGKAKLYFSLVQVGLRFYLVISWLLELTIL